MKDDFLWQLFLDTGDPMCWVLYRRKRLWDKKREDAPHV